MAKKKKKKQSKTVSAVKQDQLLALVLFFVAAFLFVSMLSFLFSGKYDSVTDSSYQNMGGAWGYDCAHYLINRTFGIGAFAIVFLLVLLIGETLKRPFFRFFRTFLFTVLYALLISISLGYLSIVFDRKGFILWGGEVGIWVSRSLIQLFGLWMIPLLLTVLFVMILSLHNHELLSALKKILLQTVEYGKHILQTVYQKIISWKKEHKSKTKNRKKKKNKKAHYVIAEEHRDLPKEKEIELSADDGVPFEAIVANAEKPENKPDDDTTIPSYTPKNKGDVEWDVIEPVEEEEVDKEFHGEISQDEYDPTAGLSQYQLPPLDLLLDHQMPGQHTVTEAELAANKAKIVETLNHYKVQIVRIKATIGPTVTLYEIVPAPGIRISRIQNLEKDIALSLAAIGIRIIAPIPGKGTIGIEVPNQHPEIVSMRSVLMSKKFQESKAELPLAMGKTISGEVFIADLAKMPHVLVAGATGQGKSVGINAMITSLLYKKHPSQIKFVMVDPKKVELSPYNVIEKHFLAKMDGEEEPIINDVQKVKNTLNSITMLMDNRYELLKIASARNLKEYNKKFVERRLNPEKGHHFMSYIVLVVDEFADLIMTAGKEVEQPIARIAQLARAVGIHMILATQRPSTNIITGSIKANFPARIAFKVVSTIDSRTILDQMGADQLVGKGDMLVSLGSDMTRVQCAFVDTPEVEEINKFISDQQGYPSAFYLPEFKGDTEGGFDDDVDFSKQDEMFEEVARLVVLNQFGSTSAIQRKLSIGYNRAGRIMDQLEHFGIVGPAEGSKPRKVLIQDEMSLDRILESINKK